MQKWEVARVPLNWDTQRQQWISPADQNRGGLIGSEGLSDWYGERGWELVSVVVATYEAGARGSTMVVEWHATRLSYMFKRPKVG